MGEALGSVRASTAKVSPWRPLVMNILVPFRTYSSAVLGGRKSNGLDVAASIGFGERQPAPHGPPRHGGEKGRLLSLSAEVGDDVGHDVVGADYAADTHPPLGDLLENHGEGGIVEPHPSPLFRNGDAKEAHPLHLLDKIERHYVFLIVLVSYGKHIAVARSRAPY